MSSNASSAADHPSEVNPSEKQSRKPAFRFNVRTDIALLKVVVRVQPYAAPHGQTYERWNKVAARLNAVCSVTKDNKKASPKNCQSRFTDLIKKFKQDDMESLRAAGTDEEYREREQLLNDLIDLMQEAEEEKAEKKRKMATDEDVCETNGAKIHDAATKRLKQKHDFDSDEENDSETSSPPSATGSPHPKSDLRFVAMTISSLAEMFKESNAAHAAFLKSSFDGAAEDRQLRKKELELEERKLALDEKRMELLMMQLQNTTNK